MTTKRIMGIIALVIVVVIAGFIFILYATIKTKSTSLNKYEPFKEWVGKTVTLDKETVVFEEKVKMNANNKYPYVLMDSLHPHWEYIRDQEKIGDVTQIKTFPQGTKLSLEKAIPYTYGVSGSSYPTIFGTISDGEKEYRVVYQWGKVDFNIDFIRTEKCWHFNKAPWQSKQDTSHYALPRSDWW